jgi:translocation and assembly module TamB
MRIFFRILQLFISPLIFPTVLIATVVYFLGATTIGLQTTIQMVDHLIPGKLTVQHAQGNLFSEMTLNNITYHNDNTDIAIQFFDFAWNPKELLESKLSIKHLIFHDASIKHTSAPDQKPEQFDFDKLKFYAHHLRIHQIAIYNVALTLNNQAPINITEVKLQQNDSENFTFYAATSDGNIEGTLAEQWNARWNFKVADLTTYIPEIRGSANLSGTIVGPRLSPAIVIKADAKQLAYANQTIGKLAATLNFTLRQDTTSALTVTAENIKVQNYSFKAATFNINGKTTPNQQNWLTTLTVALNKKPYVNILFTLPKTFDFEKITSQAFAAKLNFNPIDIDTLTVYLPAIKNLHGKIIGAVEFRGTLSNPQILGDATFSNGKLTVPELGITLKNIALRITGNESKRVTYAGSFTSDKGTAEIRGTTDLAQDSYPTTMTLQGKNLQVANLSEYKIHASPELTLKYLNNILSLDGKILIPQAKITPKNFTSVVTLSSDVVFVGQKRKTTSSFLEDLPTLQVTISLGDDIYLHYQDLEAKLKGSINITKAPNSLPTGIGELYATEGTYSAYKKILTIKEGRLIYTGNLITNPGLNIKATRQLKTVQVGSVSDFTSNQTYEGTQTLTVGVQVAGTLDKPAISLFSSPSLGQVDILSYLVLGIPSSQASGGNSQALLAAASAMDLGGSGASHLASITNGLKKTLGLSELNVESVQSFDPTANQNAGGVVGTTSLVVGKQIAKNLSVHYSTSLNLLNPVSTFNLRYKLSKRFSIQSETSTIDTGADLLYSIERD